MGTKLSDSEVADLNVLGILLLGFDRNGIDNSRWQDRHTPYIILIILEF